MREILFRGKRIDNGEWVEGYVFDNDFPDDKRYFVGSLVIEPDGGSKSYDFDVTGINFCEVAPETICQYTGMTDKNGKKIFEGDIVTVPADDELYSVTWNEDTAAWSLSAETVVYTFDNFWGYEVEVVSNVFDNPEWLEV